MASNIEGTLDMTTSERQHAARVHQHRGAALNRGIESFGRETWHERQIPDDVCPECDYYALAARPERLRSRPLDQFPSEMYSHYWGHR